MRRLILRPGAIGDVIVSLPALEYLKTGYTEVWTSSAAVPLIGFADRVRPLASTGIDLLGITADRLPALECFDSIVSWYGSNRPEFRDAVSHLPFEFHSALPDGSCHAVDFYLHQAGAPPGGIPVVRTPGPAAGFLALHPYSGSRRKNWPLTRFRELAALSPWPAGYCEEPEHCYRFSDLGGLADWLSTARAYAGNDSGISHLAAACGVPSVVLFGPTDPRVWAPRGPRVQVLQKPAIEDIGAEEVLDCLRCVLSRQFSC